MDASGQARRLGTERTNLRIPTPLAWIILIGTFGTAGLLRQFHDRTPESPMISPVVGSALFAAIFLLLLVTAYERRKGAVSGPGVRLGSLTPLLLLLLIEKWVSLTLYHPLFGRVTSSYLEPDFADALFSAFAGIGLLVVCLIVGWTSMPTMRKVWRRARPARWPIAAIGTLAVIGGGYLLLAGLSALLGGGLRLHMPRPDSMLLWVVGGQGVLAFAEEVYYRGLLMVEMQRLAPRLGVRRPEARRWIALLSTSLLFGLEHLTLGPPWGQSLRELVFVISLGLLFGILVMVSTNLHFAAGVHAWINWLLLGAAPYFVDGAGRPALPSGTYIGLILILAFVLTYAFRLWRRGRAYREPVLES
jgi:membrane protease YdiL (CAAX protease family)